MKMFRRYFSVRTTQLICAGIALSTLVFNLISWRLFLLSILLYFIFLCFGIAIGYHRGLSHRLLPPDSFGMWFCLFLGTLTTMGRPLSWVLVHRMHHMNSDEERDPHSPVNQGFWIVFFNIWKIQPSKTGNSRPNTGLIRDLVAFKSVKFFQRFYVPTLLLYIFLLGVIGGLEAIIYGYCWPVVLSVLATSLVNAGCHKNGVPKDIWWISLVTFGEGIHGLHHSSPARTNLTQKNYFDLSGWIMTKIWKSNGEIL